MFCVTVARYRTRPHCSNFRQNFFVHYGRFDVTLPPPKHPQKKKKKTPSVSSTMHLLGLPLRELFASRADSFSCRSADQWSLQDPLCPPASSSWCSSACCRNSPCAQRPVPDPTVCYNGENVSTTPPIDLVAMASRPPWAMIRTRKHLAVDEPKAREHFRSPYLLVPQLLGGRECGVECSNGDPEAGRLAPSCQRSVTTADGVGRVLNAR